MRRGGAPLAVLEIAAVPCGEKFRPCGMPLSAWAYALRIWAAMMLALLVSFWLQLDNPASSAITVGILSQARRGEAFSKALYRALGTLVGFVASVAITALFPQARDLFLLAFASWLAVCVYCGSLFGGTQAYAFVLAGYTVAIIVVQLLDHPQQVFTFGVGRLAVVLVGIVSISLVNGIFGAPDVLSDVRAKLGEALGAVRGLVRDLVAGRAAARDQAGDLAIALSGLREDIAALSTERPEGAWHAGAARSAAAALIEALLHARLAGRLVGRGTPTSVAAPAVVEAQAALALAEAEIAALEADRPPRRALPRSHLPVHRNRKAAARKAFHVFAATLAASVFFVVTGWPYASQALVQVAILGCLSAIVPDEVEFAGVCLIAMPLAAAIAGVTEFLVLDGADSFTLLALGTAPGLFLACLLFCNEKTSEVGFLTVIYIPNFIEPSNPQSYDPQLYILYSFLYTLGVVVLAVALAVIWPITPRDRRRWIGERLVADAHAALAGVSPHDATALFFLAADRASQLAEVELGGEAAQQRRLGRLFDLSSVAAVAVRAYGRLGDVPPNDAALAARDALRTFEPNRLEAAAARLADAAAPTNEGGGLGADLRLLAALARVHGPALRHLGRALPSGIGTP